MHAHLATPPPKLTDVRPDLPEDLDRVIARAMAKSRDDRFDSASEMLNAAHASVLRRWAPATAPWTSRTRTPVAPPQPEEPVASVVRRDARSTGPRGGAVHTVTEQPASTAAPVAAESAPAPADTGSSAAAPPAPPVRERRGAPGWIATALLAAGAAVAAAAVAYLLAHDDSPASTATSTTEVQAPASLEALVPRQLWKDCVVQGQPATGAVQTAACTQSGDLSVQNPPDHWDISIYPSGQALAAAYTAAREAAGVKEGGRCDGTSWGGAGLGCIPATRPNPAATGSATSTGTTR